MRNKEHYREIAEKVESGEYFAEAVEWYQQQYQYNFISRAWLVLLIIFMMFIIHMAHVYKSSILPIKKSLPVQVNITSAADLSTRIKYLGNAEKDFDVNDVFAKYFSGKFAEAIESYDYDDGFQRLRSNKNMIETLANNDIYGYYLDKISIRNLDSMIMRYKRDVKRKIEVTDIKIEHSDDQKYGYYLDEKNKDNKDLQQYKAVVDFTATEIDTKKNKSPTKWRANIVLYFQTITYNYEKKDFSPFNFKVVSYESKRID